MRDIILDLNKLALVDLHIKQLFQPADGLPEGSRIVQPRRVDLVKDRVYLIKRNIKTRFDIAVFFQLVKIDSGRFLLVHVEVAHHILGVFKSALHLFERLFGRAELFGGERLNGRTVLFTIPIEQRLCGRLLRDAGDLHHQIGKVILRVSRHFERQLHDRFFALRLGGDGKAQLLFGGQVGSFDQLRTNLLLRHAGSLEHDVKDLVLRKR